MENVTKAKGIVRRIEDPHHAGGDVLLVFRQERSGKERFHSRVEPGEEFAPALVDRFRNFIGYAVQKEQFFHKFSQRYQHFRQAHSFTLHYRLDLEVAEPEEVQKRCSRDPLRTLQEEAEEQIGAEVSRQQWEEIADDPATVGARALGTVRQDHRGRFGQTVAGFLDQRARELGFRLLGIAVRCEVDEKVASAVKEAEKKAKLEEIKVDTEIEIAQRSESHKVEKLEQELQGEIEGMQLERERMRAQSARYNRWADSVIERLDQAVGRVAGQIDDVTTLTTAIREVAQLRVDIKNLATVGQAALPGASDRRSGTMPALPPADGLDRCAQFLHEAFLHIGSLEGEIDEKRGWLALVLCMTATSLDRAVTGKSFDELGEDFRHRYAASVRSLRNDGQRRFFEQLRHPEELRAQLMGEES